MTEITDILAGYEKHLHDARVALQKIQRACKHEHLAHWDGHDGNRPHHPARICLDCRFVEEGSWWAGRDRWSAKDFVPAILGGPVEKDITKEELHDLWLPSDIAPKRP